MINPLPNPPSIDYYYSMSFAEKADVFLAALPSLVIDFSEDIQWVCSYCRTKTNLLTYKQQGLKSCYNCGSNEGEIK